MKLKLTLCLSVLFACAGIRVADAGPRPDPSMTTVEIEIYYCKQAGSPWADLVSVYKRSTRMTANAMEAYAKNKQFEKMLLQETHKVAGVNGVALPFQIITGYFPDAFTKQVLFIAQIQDANRAQSKASLGFNLGSPARMQSGTECRNKGSEGQYVVRIQAEPVAP